MDKERQGTRTRSGICKRNIAVKTTGNNPGKTQASVQNNPGRSKESGGGNPGKKKETGRWKSRIPTYNEYTPLNASLENIYLSTCNTFQYRKPRPKESTEEKKRNGKYCHFHESYGHNIEKCRHLHDAIEKLIRQNKLQEFVKDPQDGRQETSDPRRGPAPHQPEQPTRIMGRLVINTIAGGPHPTD